MIVLHLPLNFFRRMEPMTLRALLLSYIRTPHAVRALVVCASSPGTEKKMQARMQRPPTGGDATWRRKVQGQKFRSLRIVRIIIYKNLDNFYFILVAHEIVLCTS